MGYDLPHEITKIIKEYLPRDRAMSSPTCKCIKHLMRKYHDPDNEEDIGLYPSEYETFSEYCFRRNSLERVYTKRLRELRKRARDFLTRRGFR